MPYFFIFLLFITTISAAQESSSIALEKVSINIHDMQSIKRGGKFFANNCMVCHTMIYLRYDKLAQSVGVRYDKMPVHVTQWPNNVKPPDLSLEASHRGINWLYTYLHSFYSDSSRPTGANNLVVPNTAMPYMLAPYQGQQVRVPLKKNFYQQKYQWYDLLLLQTNGSMTPEQFDATIADLVNFLSYASNPYQVKQRHLGWIIINFLIILAFLIYLLKRSYWKNL